MRLIQSEFKMAYPSRKKSPLYFNYLLSVNVLVDYRSTRIGWLVVLGINVDLAIFQPYLDLEEGDNQSLKIQVARPGIEPPVLLMLRNPRA